MFNKKFTLFALALVFSCTLMDSRASYRKREREMNCSNKNDCYDNDNCKCYCSRKCGYREKIFDEKDPKDNDDPIWLSADEDKYGYRCYCKQEDYNKFKERGCRKNPQQKKSKKTTRRTGRNR